MADLKTTTELLNGAASGDDGSRQALLERYLPRLKAWAHGRLPVHGRDLCETDDLVQITLIRALARIDAFEYRKPGAFLSYLRTILMNSVRDEIRRKQRRPGTVDISGGSLPSEISVVESMIGQDVLAAYEAGLAKMDEDKRNAVIMRIEFGMSYEEIAEELERPSANAARMMISRSLTELAENMPDDHRP